MNLADLSQKGDFVSSIIRSLGSCSEPHVMLESIKKGINFLTLYPIEDVEYLLQHLMCVMPQVVRQIFDENTRMVQSGEDEDLHDIRNNFQVALNLMDVSNQILDHIMQYETVSFSYISSVPINLAQVLLLTFEHCKNSQKVYHANFKSVTEVVDLFRQTQGVHTKFLKFLDACLVFNFINENEVIAFRNLLDVILKTSEALSGINIKSMADNWKGFITLVQKCSNTLPTKSFDVSTAVSSLTEEIDKNMQIIYELGSSDFKKSTQILKIDGFLIKIVMKLFETKPNIFQNCDDIFNFCFMIYSWHPGIFQTHNLPTEFVDAINTMLYQNTESFVSQLFSESMFMKKLCLLDKSHVLLSKRSFGFVNFSNEFLKSLPKIVNEEPKILEDIEIVSLLCLILSGMTSCYKQYFHDYDSLLYDELIINISAVILLLPNKYLEMEKVFLDCLTQEKIWTVMVAMDIWCMVLRHSPESTSRLSINMLVRKIQDLNLGVFIQTPAIIYLKILIQRIFKLLPNNMRNEEVAKYNPHHNLFVWKILSLKNIPLSQRFYIEFILGDFFDKIDNIEKEDCSISEILLLMENLDIISCIKYDTLELNTSPLVSCVNRLWSFNLSELSLSNMYFKYFMCRLIHLTVTVLQYLNEDFILLVLNQIKQLLMEDIFQLLVCDILQAMSTRNFDNFQEKLTLFSLMLDIFQVLLTTKNPVVMQRSLEVFHDISKNKTCETVVGKILTISPIIKKLITKLMHVDTVEMKYNLEYLDKLDTWKFQHYCLEWMDSDLPRAKKLKVDEDTDLDDVISSLKINAQKLSRERSRTQLNSRQEKDIKSVIYKLEMLLS